MKNKNSNRLYDYDYSSDGLYFITICTKNRIHFLGEIDNNKLVSNAISEIASNIWFEIPQHFPFVDLDSFIIMPNHIHGIVQINQSKVEQSLVEARLIAPLPMFEKSSSINFKGGFAGINNPMLHQNLSRIIRWYKGRCTFEIRKINPEFEWQSRFYDHIIKNNESLENIRHYIKDNPSSWMDDEFNK